MNYNNDDEKKENPSANTDSEKTGESEYAITRENAAGYSFGKYSPREDYTPQAEPKSIPTTPNSQYNYGSSQSAASGQGTAQKGKYGKKTKTGRRAAGLIIAALLLTVGVGALSSVITYNLVSGDGNTAVTGGSADINYAQDADKDTDDSVADTNTVSTDGSALTGQEIYALACKQVVGINSEIATTNIFGEETSATVSGTGIVLTEDGYILTNYHVVQTASEGGYELSVMFNDGTSYSATLVGYEADDTDVAVLKINATGLSAATIGNSNNMEVAEMIYAVGNPLGELTYTITSGIVSAMDRAITFTDSTTGSTDTINMFQIDAAVNAGNSGGPVYNGRGEVIGIVTAKYDSSSTGSTSSVEGIGFAIPINDAVDIAKDLIEYGYVAGKPSFGIEVRTISSAEAEYYNLVAGAYVATIADGGAAEKAGIKVGDIITKLGDVDITSYSDLNSAKKDYSAGDTANITVYRDGEYIELQITFDEMISTASTATGDEQTDTTDERNLPDLR